MSLRSDLLPALGVFAAAARHQNLARAAEELHLTASAVSHHVRKLEARLDVALFQRHARGVSLTPEGRQLADAAANAIDDIESVLACLHRRRTEPHQVRITTLHSFAYTWLIPRLPRFRQAHPQVSVRIDTEIALTRFDDGGPDLGVRHGPGQWPGLAAHYLMDDHLYPVAAPTLPGIDALQGPADILRLPLVSDLGNQGWRDWLRAVGVRGPRLPPMHTFSDATDALQAAAIGLGAVLARSVIAAPWLASGQLQRLPGPALKARFAYYVVRPTHRRPSPAAQSFIDWIRHEATQSAP